MSFTTTPLPQCRRAAREGCVGTNTHGHHHQIGLDLGVVRVFEAHARHMLVAQDRAGLSAHQRFEPTLR